MNKIKSWFLNDYVILGFIIANALLIFFQEFEFSSNVLNYLEPLFTLIFIVEMIIKLRTLTFKKYFSDGWNKLDFVLVLLSIPSLAVIFYNDNALQLNILLTFRAFRVFKFFRLVRFFPNVNHLISSIRNAIKASYFVFAGFFLLVFIISLVTCSLFKNIAPEYFGNPLESFYSIFRLFSVEGWYEIPDLIATRTSTTIAVLSKIYFVFLLFCGGILGLSLVNSIFVDAMISDNTDELKDEILKLSEKIDNLNQNIKNQENNHS